MGIRGINFLFLPCLCVGSNLGTQVVRLGGKPLPTHPLPTDPSHQTPEKTLLRRSQLISAVGPAWPWFEGSLVLFLDKRKGCDRAEEANIQ